MENKLLVDEHDSQRVILTDDLHQLLAHYIREVFARRKYARVEMRPNVDINGRLIEFDATLYVDDYEFRVLENRLIVKLDCKTIGECTTNTDLIGWLFQLMDYVIEQCQVKNFRRICIPYEL